MTVTTNDIDGGRFGAVLLRLRQQRGLSLRRLGRLVHYSHGFLWDLEAGIKRPNQAAASALDAALRADGQLVSAAADLLARRPAGLHGSQPRSGLHRRAVLRVLADLGGLTSATDVRDRMGRTGIAVSLTTRGVRYTLILDPSTGRLLASAQRSVGAHEYLDVPHGLVRYCTLYIEQTRRGGLS